LNADVARTAEGKTLVEIRIAIIIQIIGVTTGSESVDAVDKVASVIVGILFKCFLGW
jgi:hypothetical protein